MARSPLKQAEAKLRDHALSFPEATEEFPWDERVIKIRGKIIVFLGEVEGMLRVAVKLPTSAEMALTLPFTTPTGYGLGRAGWVTARFGAGDAVPLALVKEWIEQSYRAVAPKTVLKALGGEPASRRR